MSNDRRFGLFDRLRSGRVPSRVPASVPGARPASADETVSVGVAAETPGTAEPTAGGAVARGSSLGRYRVLHALGAGGSANVYAAYDPELDREVALKVLRGGADRARLLREAQAAARLNHPNVVTVHDAGMVDGRLFVAMERVDGVTLGGWLGERPRPWRESVRVLRAAGAGLAAAHAAGLVHGDFKPGNVMVARDGRVLVLDFGLARPVEADGDGAAERAAADDPAAADADPAAPEGTPAYMAPELRRGGAAGPRADQYAFCVTLHRALYGVLPAAGTGTDPSPGPWPPRLPSRPHVPAALRRVLARGLAGDPGRRFASMDELVRALGRAAHARRRRLAWAGGAAAAALVAATVVGASRTAACTGADERLAGVWDEGTRAEVERAFAASGHGAAADLSRRTRALLDGYAERWAAVYREACEATRLRGEQSEQVLDLQMACLDARREELATVARILARADRDLVGRAVGVAESLTSLERCANRALLRAGPAPPADPEAAAAVAGVRTRLARAKTLEAAGRYGETLEIAQAALERARQIGHPPVEAEALIQLAQAQGRTGLFADMRRSLIAAASVAEGAGHDRAVGMAFTFLIAAAVMQGDAAEAHLWGELSGGALERLADRDGVAGHRELFLGELAHFEGRYEDAIEHHRAYLRLSAGFGSVGRAYAHLHLARQYSALGELDTAERELEEADRLFRAALGGEHRAIAQTVTQIGHLAARRGDLDGAVERYRHALDVLARAGEPDDFDTADALDGLGRSLLALGRAAEARAPIERSLAARRARPGRPADLGGTLFLFARALEAAGERAAADARAWEARAVLAGLEPPPAARLAEIDAWLAAPGGPS